VSSRARQGAVAVLLAVSACASHPVTTTTSVPVPTPSGAAAAPAIPDAVRWFRASAERRAVYLEIYSSASITLARRSAGLEPQSWAVILDADETVIDNSPYEQMLAERHAAYDATSWNEWVRREAAPALAGAVAFTRRVHALGGRVVIVTNRDDTFCQPTKANLERVGITADEVLCRTDSTSDSKDPRFDAVASGHTPSTLPPLRVVMWVGDNIQDFPHLTQAIRLNADSSFADFGERFIVLPNPMYGSWTRNPMP
jgi:5'-nucleotidase (lipoprotein e(P4) family)